MMQCPCCQKQMNLIKTHFVRNGTNFEGREYKFWLCEKGNNLCNGLLVKLDVFDKKYTYITPCHTTTTLHVDYVSNISAMDLLKSIFTTFEWLANAELKEA